MPELMGEHAPAIEHATFDQGAVEPYVCFHDEPAISIVPLAVRQFGDRSGSFVEPRFVSRHDNGVVTVTERHAVLAGTSIGENARELGSAARCTLARIRPSPDRASQVVAEPCCDHHFQADRLTVPFRRVTIEVRLICGSTKRGRRRAH